MLAGKGLELAWAADPVDVFFLQIQGSGRLIFDDGTQAFVNYAGQNGHKYKSSGRIMREKGLLKEGHIFEQREWFKNNPQRVDEILHENPSYVFFRFGNRGPTGAIGAGGGRLALAGHGSQVHPAGGGGGLRRQCARPGFTGPSRCGASALRRTWAGPSRRNRIDIFCGGERANYVAVIWTRTARPGVLVAR